MDYTPTLTPAPQVSPPVYELVEDVSGEPPPARGSLYVSNNNGFKLEVPFMPKSGCRKCFGRGYVGLNPKIGLVACRKCYPLHR